MSEISVAQRCSNYMWRDDIASQNMGMVITYIDSGIAHLCMPVTATMLNGQGICHGGFIFTLADSAFAFACNSHNDKTVAQSGSVEFLRPALLDDQLTAVATEISRGKRTGIYDVTVHNQDEKVVAIFRGKSFALNQPLLPEPEARQ